MKRWGAVFCLFILVCGLAEAARGNGESETGVLTLLHTIEVGGRPDTIIVDRYYGRNDLVFWDSFTSEIRFLDGNTLLLQPESISLPSWSTDRVLAYDRVNHRTYALTTLNRGSPPDNWVEAEIHVLGWRQKLAQFSVNANFNSVHPVDERYYVDGFQFRQPGEEGPFPGRLILDNGPQGNLDVIDFNRSGNDVDRIQRTSYRAPVPTTGFYINQGNTLALETQHETLSNDDLIGTDHLYISDANHTAQLHLLRLNHPKRELGANILAPIDLAPFNCGAAGCKGVSVVGPRDLLYLASGNQVFEHGYLNQVDTTTQQMLPWIELLYGDHNFLHADWADPSRLFVAVHDWYGSYDPVGGLYLYLIDNRTVVGSVLLLENYVDGLDTGLRDMVFDPYSRRLYVTVGSKVLVVGVDYGAPPPSLPPPPPVIASILLDSPFYAGTLTTPDDSATLSFTPSWVSEPTVVTYTHKLEQTAGSVYGVRFFELAAVPVAGGAPLTSTNPYAMTLIYSDLELGGAIESSLNLFWWDGSAWVPEPTAMVDTAANEITAVPEYAGQFAILGDTNRLYLPVVKRP